MNIFAEATEGLVVKGLKHRGSFSSFYVGSGFALSA
jgi:hypothetical protein